VSCTRVGYDRNGGRHLSHFQTPEHRPWRYGARWSHRPQIGVPVVSLCGAGVGNLAGRQIGQQAERLRRHPCASPAVSKPLSCACAPPKVVPASRGTISRRRIARRLCTSASRLRPACPLSDCQSRYGGLKGQGIQRVGNLVAMFRIGACEFLAPAVAHGLRRGHLRNRRRTGMVPSSPIPRP